MNAFESFFFFFTRKKTKFCGVKLSNFEFINLESEVGNSISKF